MGFVLDHTVVTARGTVPSRTAFVLHGILGQGRNWRSFAGRLVDVRPDWRVVLVDLRNHGKSQGAPPPHTIAACVDDVDALADVVGPPTALIGHSFGGKVALLAARQGLAQVWALDAHPGPGDLTGDLPRVLRALRDIPVPLDSREALLDAITARGLSEALGTWLGTSLKWSADGYRWVFDLDAIDAMLASYVAADAWSVLESPPCEVHLVRAGRGGRWSEGDVRRIAASRAVDHVLADAGHWLHVDDPEGLLAVVAGGLP